MVYKIADIGVNFVRTNSRGVTGCVDGSYAAEALHWPLLLEQPGSARSGYPQ